MKKIILAALLCLPSVVAAQTPAAIASTAPVPVTAQPGDAALIQHCDGLFNLAKTYALARNWIDAWNSTSVDRVMALYTPDFEFRARGVLSSNRKSSPNGVLHGQADNRLRWFDPALVDANGASSFRVANGGFRLIDAYAGVRSIAVHYLNTASEETVEVMEYTPSCKIERSNAMYGPMPAGIPNSWEARPTSPDGIVQFPPIAPR